MDTEQMITLRDRLIAAWESEVVGSDYRPQLERLQSLKNEIANGADPSATFREIHELAHVDGRVLLFEIPPAPRGIPIAWNGHHYARNGESLGVLDLGKLDEIRQQDSASDWSAEIVAAATVDDLDPDALAAARTLFATRHPARLTAQEVDSWSVTAFLERSRLSIDGELPRATLLLLGKADSAHLLSPLLAEITWKLVGEERAYEHFGLPFMLNTTKVYDRIRNVQVRLLTPGTLIQTEIPKYDKQSILEGIHNCVAHADYRSNARIVLSEHVDRIVLENDGAFFDGQPDDYVLSSRTPRKYRNPFLVRAMTELNMIDRMGWGIQIDQPLPSAPLSATPRLRPHRAQFGKGHHLRRRHRQELHPAPHGACRSPSGRRAGARPASERTPHRPRDSCAAQACTPDRGPATTPPRLFRGRRRCRYEGGLHSHAGAG